MNRRVTLSDIARRVGVSTSSVSLALRGQSRISAGTAERIRAEATKLGYIYNRAAAGLRTSQSEVVAVCLSDLTNPVFNEFLTHIEDELRTHGRAVFLGVARESRDLQARILRRAMEQGAGGLMLCPVHGTTAGDLAPLFPGGAAAPVLPCAVFSREIPGAALPQFVNDDVEAGRLAGRAVLQAGHRLAAWLGGGQETSTSRGRWQGFAETFRDAGMATPQRRPGPTSRRFGYEAARGLLEGGGIEGDAPPTALVCFSDLIAFGALAACHDLDLVPGRQVSVVGCDDMEEAMFTRPQLATVRVDKSGIGRAAARALLAAIEGGAVAPGLTSAVPHFVARASLGPPVSPG